MEISNFDTPDFEVVNGTLYEFVGFNEEEDQLLADTVILISEVGFNKFSI